MTRSTQKRGVALLWALILTTVLLIISGSTASVIIKESRMTLDVTDSSQAYANARSGTDWAQKYIQDSANQDAIRLAGSVNYEFNLNNGSVAIEIASCAVGDGCDFKIDSIGYDAAISGASVSRKIQTKINLGNIGTKYTGIGGNYYIDTNTQSFELNFDFWLSASPAPTHTEWRLGLKNLTSGNAIGIKIDSTNGLKYGYSGNSSSLTGNLTPKDPSIIPPITISRTEPLSYHARIIYLKDTSIIFIVSEKDASDKYNCIASYTAPVVNNEFGDLNLINSVSGGGDLNYMNVSTPNVNQGDGQYLLIDNKILMDNFYVKFGTP